jgi:hypothetical protein
MRSITRFLMTVLITGLLFPSVYSQTSAAYFIMHKTNDKFISKSDNGEKTLVFDIAGLSSKTEVDALVTKIKTLRGVVSAVVEENSTDGTWETTVVFYKYANKKYFPQFFSWCGIQTLMIDNTTYDSQTFEKISD